MTTTYAPMPEQPPHSGHFIASNDGKAYWLDDRMGCQDSVRVFTAPHQPGDRVPLREPWMLSCFVDVAAAHPCDEEDLHTLKYVLRFKDADGDWQTYRTIWPRDKDYAKFRPLVTSYADECRERPAEELPDWLCRNFADVLSCEPELCDGLWRWKTEFENDTTATNH